MTLDYSFSIELELDDGSSELIPVTFDINLTAERSRWLVELSPASGVELVAATLFANTEAPLEYWPAIREILLLLCDPEIDEDRLSGLVRPLVEESS